MLLGKTGPILRESEFAENIDRKASKWRKSDLFPSREQPKSIETNDEAGSSVN